MVKIEGKIHSCHPGQAQAIMELNGREIEATIQVVVVEIVGNSRTLTLDLSLADAEAAGLAVGREVTLTLEVK